MNQQSPAIKTGNASKVVLNFINALNAEDFDKIKEYVTDDLTFIGVLGERHGAESYIYDMKKMKLKYEIKKIFESDKEVCLWYDIDMGKATIFASGWYKTINGKINWFTVLFDPRPLLSEG